MRLPHNNAANQAVDFLQALNLIDDYAGQLFKLRPWQELIVRNLFGRLDKDGNNVIRRCLILLCRKAGKTYLTATICLLTLLLRGNNQQIICCASSQKQAKRVYDSMVKIIRQDDVLKEILECIPSQGRIVCESTNSFFVAEAAGEGIHGYSPTVCVVEEAHVWNKPKHHRVFAGMTTGLGARTNPLVIMISTQSADRTSIAYQEFEYAKNLKGRIENGQRCDDGTITNENYLAILYYLKPEDEERWDQEDTWRLVNPALGDFCSLKEYQEQCQYAKEIPGRLAAFKQLYLNAPATDDNKWMDMTKWDSCRTTPEIPDGAECYAALDLAPSRDLSALSLLFPLGDKLGVKQFFWCNGDDIIQRTHEEKVPYIEWAKQGFITATPGSSTDFNAIKRDIIELSHRYRIKKFGADMAHAFQLCQELRDEESIEAEWFRQGFISMGPPTARLEKLVLDQTIQHEGNPVLDYCISNVRVETDAAGNQKPSNKLRLRHERIDGAVSLIMAVGLWMHDLEPQSIGISFV